jgi:hypothetical protein
MMLVFHDLILRTIGPINQILLSLICKNKNYKLYEIYKNILNINVFYLLNKIINHC